MNEVSCHRRQPRTYFFKISALSSHLKRGSIYGKPKKERSRAGEEWEPRGAQICLRKNGIICNELAAGPVALSSVRGLRWP